MADKGGIYRTKKDKQHPYFMANREPYTDKTLSWEARGVMAYLMSKPDNWTVRFWDLVNQCDNCGRDKMRRILKQLEQAGYMKRVRVNSGKDGTFTWITYVYETPAARDVAEEQELIEEIEAGLEPPSTDFQGMDEPPSTGLPSVDKPSTGEPSTVNPSIYRIMSIENKEQKNKREEKRESDPEIDEVFTDGQAIWTQALNDLSGMMTRQTFDQHLKDTTAELMNGTGPAMLKIHVRTAFAAQWLHARLQKRIAGVVADAAGRELDVMFTAEPPAEV